VEGKSGVIALIFDNFEDWQNEISKLPKDLQQVEK
jgi:hypothetical protein